MILGVSVLDLTIAAARERARGSGPAGQTPLTRNEIAHLLAVINTAPAPATTTAKQPKNREHKDLRLEY
jgi:hypothetical protein